MNFAILCKALALPNQRLAASVREMGSLESIFNAHPDDLEQWFSLKDIARIHGWHESKTLMDRCSSIEQTLKEQKAKTLCLGDQNYPALLAEIPDAPVVLFIKGEEATLTRPQIAIVGSRNCTAQGRRIAYEFASELSAAGFYITSGLALGIDAAAHEGAINSRGKTCAVMGTGPDIVYPACNKALADTILNKGGGLVTEFLPGSPPRAQHFPLRNRIVTGLSLGVLVVEAGERSGSLISARLAAEQGREVFAVPGSLLSPVSAGCNRMIRDGATLVTEPRQMVEQLGPMLGFQIQAQESPPVTTPGNAATKILDEDHWLIAKMGYDPVSVDELCALCERSSSEVTAALAELELSGVVAQTAFGYQRRA